MRENDLQREVMGKILKSGKVKGFMTIDALLTEDNEIHVFPDAVNMPQNLAIKACEFVISSLYGQDGMVQ